MKIAIHVGDPSAQMGFITHCFSFRWIAGLLAYQTKPFPRQRNKYCFPTSRIIELFRHVAAREALTGAPTEILKRAVFLRGHASAEVIQSS